MKGGDNISEEREIIDEIDKRLEGIKEPSKPIETKPVKTDDKPIKSTDKISKEKKSKVAYVVLVTVVVIVAIILAGFQYGIIDFGVSQNGVIKDPVLQDAEPYLNGIVSDDIELRSYANSIVSDCSDKECQINAMYRYIVENFNYLSNPVGVELIQTPQETIDIGGGDCEDLSILFISLLENIGIKAYLVLTYDHAYALAYDVDTDNLWKYIEQSFIEFAEKEWGDDIIQTYEKSFVLDGGYNWYYGGDGSQFSDYIEYLNISYDIESDKPLHFYVVPSQTDFDNLTEGKTFYYYPDYEEENILSTNDVFPYLDRYGGIILANDNWEDATVNVNMEFYFRPSFYEWFKDDVITYYNIDYQKCIVVDCTRGVWGFAGDDAGIYGEKIAIDPITLEYTYLD